MLVSISIVCAALAFLASLAGALALARANRERWAFALVVAAPLLAALVFNAFSLLPATTGAVEASAQPTSPTAVPASAAAREAVPAAAPVANTELAGWRHSAEELRRAKRYAEARDMYEKVVNAAPLDADGWADLGDASSAAAGNDLRAGGTAIDRALAIDPKHPKALWLKASLELQEKRYGDAATLWQRLLDLLPADSGDARIVKANLEESRTLASTQGSQR